MKLLVIALDGLDYEKIKKYECEELMQQEFGRVDLEGFEKLNTTELWASFLTGRMPEEHGIEGMYKWDYKTIDRLDSILTNTGLEYSIKRRIRSIFEFIGARRKTPTKEDYEVETLVEVIDNSRIVSYPSYHPFSILHHYTTNLGFYGSKYALRAAEKEHLKRKEEFEDSFLEFLDLYIQHFHKFDLLQHMQIHEETPSEQEIYEEADKFAKWIKERVSEDWTILFVSDHGLDEGKHRKKAFYSISDRHDVNPHMRDFKDVILELFDTKK